MATDLMPTSETIILSSGSIRPWSILAPPDTTWPTDTVAHTVFFNTAGAVLADVEAEQITADRIRYVFRPDGDQSVESVPAGARFESWIELDDGPLKLRYGIVQRAEARFPDATPSVIATGPRIFSDTFLRSGVGWKWEPTYGKVKIFTDNPLSKNPLGLGPNTNLLLGSVAATRFYKPLAGDSPEVTIVIQMPAGIGTNNGKTRAVFSADHNLNSGLAIEADSVNGAVHMCRIGDGHSFVNIGTAATGITFHDNDSFTARYNNLTDTFSIYRGSELSPMVSPWVDNVHMMPHGPGYRYLHIAFNPTLLETGPLVSRWSAMDGV